MERLVSVHGGHSGEFCSHARDSLEDIIKTYIDKKFDWVGITEHMPPISDRFVLPDEKNDGLTARMIYERFARYMETGRALQIKYKSDIEIFVGFETETYTGSADFIRELDRSFEPDYMVGSVHHVDDVCLDYSRDGYRHLAVRIGGFDRLYCKYFDQQYEMINAVKPAVVGHFDLVRLYDNNYRERIKRTEIAERIDRNLARIAELGLILDFNVRALFRGAREPYITKRILQKACDMGIAVVPGDDSHGVDTVGLNLEKGIQLLKKMGFTTDWKKPVSVRSSNVL